jgi:hypothetical protein
VALHCSGHSGPHHSAYVERVAEANLDDDHQAASFATDPCHGLFCRRRCKRVTKRHDSIRDRLARVLERVNGTCHCGTEGAEPPGRRGTEAGGRQGQQVRQHVGRRCVCSGTQRCVDQGSDTTPGLAAETYAAVKATKYADQNNFIPFILETGGRVNKKAREWRDHLTAPEPGEEVPSQDVPVALTDNAHVSQLHLVLAF